MREWEQQDDNVTVLDRTLEATGMEHEEKVANRVEVRVAPRRSPHPREYQ